MTGELKITCANQLKSNLKWSILLERLAGLRDSQIQAVDTNEFDLLVSTAGVRCMAYLLVETTELPGQYAHLTEWAQSRQHSSKTVILVGHDDEGGPYRALQELQLHLLEQPQMIAVLPFMKVEQIVNHFERSQEIEKQMSPPSSLAGTSKDTSQELMSWATTSAPRQRLSEIVLKRIRRLCGSLQDLEEATRSEFGRQQLEDMLGFDKAQSLFTFWDDEWLLQ